MIFNTPANLAPALADHIAKNNPHGTTAEDVGAVALASLMALAYRQLDASGNVNPDVISEYPTTPGVFRVGSGASMGLPGEWGMLIIWESGGYWFHLLCGNQGLWWARTENTTTVTTWNKVADVNHDHYAQAINPGSIELTTLSGSGHGGFIDFHYDGSTEDYTSRIIEYSPGTISVDGILKMQQTLDMNWQNLFNVYAFVGIEGGTYGAELPAAGIPGRIFFKKVT